MQLCFAVNNENKKGEKRTLAITLKYIYCMRYACGVANSKSRCEKINIAHEYTHTLNAHIHCIAKINFERSTLVAAW